MTGVQLHGTAFKMQRERFDGLVLTPNQEWLFDCIVSELEYRNRRARGPDRCWCGLCVVAPPPHETS